MGLTKIVALVAGLAWILTIGGGQRPVAAGESSEERFTTERRRMVESQIRLRGVSDPKVLAAMARVQRHRFVPDAYKARAYADHPLPIGKGQTISQPYIVALMTEALTLDGSMRVLEIGTGSGYQAAVLAEICGRVYTIEIFESLGRRAKRVLNELGYENIDVKIGDGYQGWPEHSPFNAIIVTCAPTRIPKPLIDQLAEGGKMIIPVGERYAQKLVLLTKKRGAIHQSDVIAVRFVPMIDAGGKPY